MNLYDVDVIIRYRVQARAEGEAEEFASDLAIAYAEATNRQRYEEVYTDLPSDLTMVRGAQVTGEATTERVVTARGLKRWREVGQ